MNYDLDTINQLARDYAQKKDTWTLEDLYKNSYPLITHEARRHHRNVQKYGINHEDLESKFSEALWKEADKYHKKLDQPFTKLFRWKVNQEVLDLIREQTAQRRGGTNTEIKIDFTVYEATLAETYRMEDRIINSMEAKKLLADFVVKANKQYLKIIQLVNNEYTNLEIAAALGSDQYSPGVRKTVQRAKDMYRAYVEAELSKAC